MPLVDSDDLRELGSFEPEAADLTEFLSSFPELSDMMREANEDTLPGTMKEDLAEFRESISDELTATEERSNGYAVDSILSDAQRQETDLDLDEKVSVDFEEELPSSDSTSNQRVTEASTASHSTCPSPTSGGSPWTPSPGAKVTLNAGDICLPYGIELRWYQKPVWNYMMQNTPGLRALTVWPRRNGKDLVALNILIAKAMQRVGLYLYLGPLQNQTRQIVWMGATDEGRKFLDFIPGPLIKNIRNSQMEIDLVNGSMIKVVGSDQYDSLMGLNALGAVFTEQSLQRPEAWEYIRPMMSANGGWALFNGTPRGLNHFHRMKEMAEQNDEWFYQYLTRDDTGRPTLEAIEKDRKAGMRESLIEQEYYCSWTSSSEESFIPLDLIEPCLRKEAECLPAEYTYAPKILGCDVAYAAKGDKAGICYRQGRKVHFLRWYQGMDNMAFAAEVARYIELVKPHAVFIDAGRGEGVISRLDQLGYSHLVRGVHFGGKTYNDGAVNIKAEMWLGMLSWFMHTNRPDLYGLDNSPYANEPVERELARELSTPHMQHDEKNRTKVEPKSSLRSRGVSSPDLAESLSLTFAENVDIYEVVDPRLADLGITHDMLVSAQSQFSQDNYDPLSYMQSFDQPHMQRDNENRRTG